MCIGCLHSMNNLNSVLVNRFYNLGFSDCEIAKKKSESLKTFSTIVSIRAEANHGCSVEKRCLHSNTFIGTEGNTSYLGAWPDLGENSLFNLMEPLSFHYSYI